MALIASNARLVTPTFALLMTQFYARLIHSLPVNVEASVSYPVKTLETGPQPQLLRQEIES